MQLKFIPKATHKYWFDNDPIKTLHANTLTSSIPYGERFFVISVIPYLKKIKDKNLKKATLQFIRQEINHSKIHYRLYYQTVKPFYPKLRIKNCFYQKIFFILAFLLGGKGRLAIVAAMEHFTAVSGAYYLQNPTLLLGMGNQISQIWRWHFTEELEHRALAFDIFHFTGRNYLLRVVGYWLAAFFLLTGFISTFFHMVSYDKLYQKRSFYRNSYQFFFGKSGLIRQLWRPYLSYLKPGFHPHTHLACNPIK